MKKSFFLRSPFQNKSLFLIAVSLSLLIVALIFGGIIKNSSSAQTIALSDKVIDGAKEDAAQIELNRQIQELANDSVWNDFDEWLKQNGAGSNDSAAQSGVNLAEKRKNLLEKLIRLSPQTALSKAVRTDQTVDLPAFVREKLEKRISFRGDFLVLAIDQVDPASGKMIGSRTEHQVVNGGERYEAYVYGRRLSMTTKLDIPLSGIVLDGIMAVDESPAQVIGSTGAQLTVQIGGEIKIFHDQAELNALITNQIEWESKIGPNRTDSNGTQLTQSAYTTGPKTVLFIRLDFSDMPGEPVEYYSKQPLTVQKSQLLMNTVNALYIANSYNQTSLPATTVTSVVRLPQPRSYYLGLGDSQGSYELMTDGRNAARAAGYETNNFDFDVLAFNFTFSYGGLGYVGGKGIWINGFFSDYPGITNHEFGHNYGLNHANKWQTTDGTITGAGSNTEYGDPFDQMGGGDQKMFSARYKRILDWMTDASVQTVTQNGTYRIYAEDLTSTGLRALRIKKDSLKDYWIDFRQDFPTNASAMNGAMIRWDYGDSPRTTQILDMSPNTQDTNDAPLQIGQTFFDTFNHVKITNLGKGNTTPQSLDVKIELNVGCTYSLNQTNSTFSATGGEGGLSVTTQSGCNLSLTSNQSWISVISMSDTAVQYTVAANYGGQRTGTLSVAGQTLTVTQSAAATACAVPPAGMVAWWRGEGSGKDETNLNNGTVLSGMSYGGGKIGGGFKGIGTNSQFYNKMIVPDSASLALNQSLSIEGWLRVDTLNTYALVVRGDDSDVFGPYNILFYSGRLVFNIKSTPTGLASAQLTSANTLTAGQFYHFAATLDNATGQMKIYINGVLSSQTTTAARPYKSLDSTKHPGIGVGNFPNAAYDSFNGVIDELSIYNRALSVAEVSSIYNAGIAVSGGTGKCLVSTKPTFDLDADGKTDLSVFRPSSATWYLQQTTAGFSAVGFGQAGDKLAPADFDGDGKTDLAVYRPSSGDWIIRRSSDGQIYTVNFGAADDLPVPADYDGDGKADINLFRPSNGVWYRLNSSNGAFAANNWGTSGDKPAIGDFDGDGKADLAVYRPSNGVWYIVNSSTGQYTIIGFGAAEDLIVPGDYDGDGKTDIAVYRPSNNVWYRLNSSNGAFAAVGWGAGGDQPVPADYDGDGKTDLAVYRNGYWYIVQSSNGQIGYGSFGNSTDVPLPNVYVR